VALDNFPDWQRENIEKAINIIEDENETFLDFTLRNEYHEYEIVEEFIGTISDDEVREELSEAIQGKGAFRRFKDGIREYEVEQQWYGFQGKKVKRVSYRMVRREGSCNKVMRGYLFAVERLRVNHAKSWLPEQSAFVSHARKYKLGEP
jgi:hypothetical protein